MRNLLLLTVALFSLSACNSSKKATNTEPGAFFTGTEWKLIKVRDKMDVVKANARTLYVEIPDKKGNGTFRGQAGCNNFNGTYTSDKEKNTIHFNDAAATKMACPDLEGEDEYFKLLHMVNSYTLANKVLKLYNGGDVLLTFHVK
jgi:heat shock protein HslJ